MILTEIRPRRHRLSQLFLDGEAAVQVDTETLLRAGYRVGDELDDEALHRLLQDSAAHRAQEKALYLLERRAHSKKELEEKIARSTLDRQAAREAADHMEEIGLIDDEQFAHMYARELIVRKKYGAMRVRQELHRKGVDEGLIAAVLEEYLPRDEEQRAAILALLQRRYPLAWQDEKVRRRAVAALQRYGYGLEDIFAVLQAENPEL